MNSTLSEELVRENLAIDASNHIGLLNNKIKVMFKFRTIT